MTTGTVAVTVTVWSRECAAAATVGQAADARVDTFGDLPRIARSHLDDGYFHVTARRSSGRLFDDDLDRLDFLDLLRSTAALLDWRCHAHCLMGTHYHLVLDESSRRLSNGMRRLNGDYARRFNNVTAAAATSSRSASRPTSSATSSTCSRGRIRPSRTRSARGLCDRGQPTGSGPRRCRASASARGPAPRRPWARRRPRRSGAGSRERARPASACGSASCPRR